LEGRVGGECYFHRWLFFLPSPIITSYNYGMRNLLCL
jgi:hypothetical protein